MAEAAKRPSRRARSLVILLAAGVAAALAAGYARGQFALRSGVRKAGPEPVGVATLHAARVPIEHWYPARRGTREARVRYEDAYLGFAARDAPRAGERERPLVVLIHGYTGARTELAWLAERVASHGFPVIAIDYADAGQVMDGAFACRRARATSAAIDAVAGAAPNIAPGRVLVVGHSFGGTTALALAGVPLEGGLSCSDKRVVGVLATAPLMDPLLVSRLEAGSPAITGVRPPILFAGDRDPLRPPARRLVSAWPGARLETVAGAGHFVFKGVCTPYAKVRTWMLCLDRPGVERVEVHDAVARATLELLEQIADRPPP